MTQDREFQPLRRGTWTGADGLVMLAIFMVLAVVAVVALLADQDWWAAPALFAVVVGVTAPIAFIAVWRHGVSRTIVVTPDTVELVKGGHRSTVRTVVHRDVESYGAAFAPVLRGWTTNASDRILLMTDGRESIWVHPLWGAETQRAIAAELGVQLRETPARRFELKASVGMRSPFVERRPFVSGLLLALSVVVVVFAVAAAAGLID
ncbi:hypothetical protein [Aeromicrobium fastidiosum]|uniref:PH domain-containing protein n=1 Tax=Aeromicrobium fastidiosum TaxID=52699 RepID=A0A641AKL5_9ACTN|nr:hypothetical protein [Aeromicrobium fastidiosum]KAA1376355.1 hypothetical protein ESP62_013050 [Aeromicrobium fastidiosum]MBP2391744.1 hypothetical protein [Aeromicrobium fastidiosum]